MKPLSQRQAETQTSQATRARTQATANDAASQVRQFEKDLRTFCFDSYARLTMMKEVQREGAFA